MIGMIARHLAGAVAALLVFVAQGIVAYVGLLVYAVITDAGLGGQLAGPFLVLLASGLGVALVPLVFVPAGLAGEAATKGGRLPLKLLIASAVAAVLATIYVAVLAAATDVPTVRTVLTCLGGVVAVLAPTTVYVAHGVLHTSSIWRRLQASASAVRRI
ncbi:hypothetical protein [Salinispora arenicola]|uniref:hypothetical protein n=1 Tax=Salinispora arenicola TaxID=168697 RepID=UPI00169AF505|nr:hypothetical protein [Salinispora arenicola]NIL64226.1 hypothetical protein [Salinispora arenicola]